MKIYTLEKCCFYLDLKLGVSLLAVIIMLIDIAFAGYSISVELSDKKVAQIGGFVLGFVIIGGNLSLSDVIASALLMYGAIWNVPVFLRSWLIVHIIHVVIVKIAVIIIIFSSKWGGLPFMILSVPISIYTWLCVFSLYMKMKQSAASSANLLN
jgi:hypothetical protein